MNLNRKPTGRALSVPGGLAVGAAWALGTTLVLSALIAKLMETEHIPQEAAGYWVMGLLTAAAFLGAFRAFCRVKHQLLLVCLTSGAIYWGILLSITALFFGGQYEAVPETALMILCGTGLAILTATWKRGRAGKRPGK